ncbi:MAG: replication protein C [Methanoculleus sp. SDB]|nr:MAG: replication protein C [Methanoculleus sp. SDB]
MLWIEKYRPRTFDEICGQPEVVRHLRRFAAGRTVPHLLLVGRHGTGKSAAVECLARGLYGDAWEQNTTIFCTGDLFLQGKQYLEADERFSHLYRKDAGLITNFKHIVKEYASLRPLDTEFKLMVFDDASSLPFEAQQALRRIMERYSATCRFLYTTTQQSSIIPAISSRCLPLFFAPVAADDIHAHLASIISREHGPRREVPSDDCDLIIQASRGDLRKAVMYLQLLAEGGETDLAEVSQSETTAIASSAFAALQARDLEKAQHLVGLLMLEYGLSGREIVSELRTVARREYNDERITLALADTDFVLGHAGSDYLQLDALLARILAEVFL